MLEEEFPTHKRGLQPEMFILNRTEQMPLPQLAIKQA